MPNRVHGTRAPSSWASVPIGGFHDERRALAARIGERRANKNAFSHELAGGGQGAGRYAAGRPITSRIARVVA